MFTGIIECVGELIARESHGGDVRLGIFSKQLDWSDVRLGDSIAVNGVCLTAVRLEAHAFYADVSLETLNRTSLAFLGVGSSVNLEKALKVSDRLGGHLVSGHVDGLARVIQIQPSARSYRFDIEAPKALSRYIAEKGSVCLDGVSLTVNQVSGSVFSINIVPHTFGVTTLGGWRIGSEINLEVDVIARYLERLFMHDPQKVSPGITESFLAEHGYLK